MDTTISALRARRILWLALAVALPLPFWSLGIGFAPPLRMFFVASLVMGFFLSSPEGMSGLLLGIFVVQGLLWLGGTYLIARIALRLLSDDTGISARRFYAVLGTLVVLALLPVYLLPLSSAATRTNWFGLFS